MLELKSLYDALSRAASDEAELDLGGVPTMATDLLHQVDRRAQALLDQGLRPFDHMAWPPLDADGLVTVLAALSIGLVVTDEPEHRSGRPWPGTLADAQEITGYLWVGGGKTWISERLLRAVDPGQRHPYAEVAPVLLQQVGAQVTPWADVSSMRRPDPGEGWQRRGMTAGEPPIPDGCIAVDVSSSEYGCCGPHMVVGDEISWRVRTHPPFRVPWMAFHLDTPDPQPVEGVIERIYVVEEEQSLTVAASDWHGPYSHWWTGRRAYRSVVACPNRRWRGDLVIAVRPDDHGRATVSPWTPTNP